MKVWLQAARALARRPAYLAAAVIVLALGIGATAALFSVVETVLLAPLPYRDSGRLTRVLELNPAKHENLIAPGRLADWNRMNQSFVSGNGIVGEYTESETDTSGAEPVRLEGVRVSPGYFRLLGVAPLAGRWFTPNEQAANGPGAAIISSGLWASRYGRRPTAATRTPPSASGRALPGSESRHSERKRASRIGVASHAFCSASW